jgi:hypothetical protein
MRHRIVATLFWTGIGCYVAGIALAMAIYPGGNRFDYDFPRFSALGNFLCDLFSVTAYNGRPNPGRPYALAGTYAFALALLAYFERVPRLFRTLPWRYRCTRFCGMAAVGISLFIPTRFHDLAILIAAPLALAAVTSAALGMRTISEKPLASLGFLTVAIALGCYLSFAFRAFPRALPLIQKSALVVFTAWVVLGFRRLEQAVLTSPL